MKPNWHDGNTASFHPDGRELQRSSHMADEQDPAVGRPDPTDGPPPQQPPAKKAPAKKTPAKKAPAKAAKKATKKVAPAKGAPAKKAPAKKTPAKAAEPATKLADTNGSSAAKETAAQAKSTITTAVPPTLVPQPGPERSNLPMAAAIVAGVLAVLVVLLARRGSAED
jgi:hypothetical protein